MNHNALKQIFPYTGNEDFNNQADRERRASSVIGHDLMWRTIHGLGKFRNSHPDYDVQIRKDAAKIVYDFLKGPCPKTQADFDEWHKKASMKVLDDYNAAFKKYSATNANGELIQINYGKAQKAINMILKNFAVMDNAAPYLNNCKFAHIPVDQDVLTYLRKAGCITGYYAWSNLDYTEYMKIQNSVRNYVPINSAAICSDFTKKFPNVNISGFTNPLTVFEAEFLIWAK